MTDQPAIDQMIRRCHQADFERVRVVINDSAQAYHGVIPEDCWKSPYMGEDELREEVRHGVQFWGYQEADQLVAVMGIQYLQEVTLIRHAYVCTARRRCGIGGKMLLHLRGETEQPLLIGTWADAVWAIRFYEKYGFRQVSRQEKDRLLRKYWSIPDRQIETSVVLADENRLELHITETQ
ncbi:MAG: GNAT family N-acetyltransferase [Acidobacteriota bacterium]